MMAVDGAPPPQLLLRMSAPCSQLQSMARRIQELVVTQLWPGAREKAMRTPCSVQPPPIPFMPTWLP